MSLSLTLLNVIISHSIEGIKASIPAYHLESTFQHLLIHSDKNKAYQVGRFYPPSLVLIRFVFAYPSNRWLTAGDPPVHVLVAAKYNTLQLGCANSIPLKPLVDD